VIAGSPAVDAQARRYLTLFPAWLRPTRGEEAVGLVLDLLPPDAQHLPWRSKLDLVRAGLHARRVGTAPMWVWWRVVYARPQGQPVPAAWLPWLSCLVRRRSFPARVGVARMLPTFGPQALLWWTTYGSTWAVVGLALSVLVGALGTSLRRRRVRRDVCLANGLGDDGRLRPPGEVATYWRVGPVGNHPIVRPLLLIAGSALAAGLPLTLVWPSNPIDPFLLPLIALLAASLTGWFVLAFWRGTHRARGAGPTWPLVERSPIGPIPATVVARLADGAGAAVGVAVAWGSAWVAVGLGAPVAALAPGAVLALGGLLLARAERRAGRTLGLWDAVPPWAPQVVVVARPETEREPMPGGPTLA
jgi:hypothetical protein